MGVDCGGVVGILEGGSTSVDLELSLTSSIKALILREMLGDTLFRTS